MTKARQGLPRRVSLQPEASTPPRPSSDGPSAPAEGQDVILGGRRYRLVPVGERPASPMGSAAMAPGESAPARPTLTGRTSIDFLTARELQIVALVADGRVNKQIADALKISEWTVSSHLRRIFLKLSVDTRAAMVSRYLQAVLGPGSLR